MISYKWIMVPKHEIKNLGLPKSALAFFDRVAVLQDSQDAIVAYDHSTPVGALLYRVDDWAMVSLGTYVARKYRHRGIATQLWKEATTEVRNSPKSVSSAIVTPVTAAGVRLVRSLVGKLPVRLLESSNVAPTKDPTHKRRREVDTSWRTSPGGCG